MANTYESLIDFVETARKNRKYADNTAGGLKAALRLFEPELNEQEKESIDVFRSNIEQIYRAVINANKNNLSVASLLTYKNRVLKVLDDYTKYGSDPSKLASWNPPTRIRHTAKTQKEDAQAKSMATDEMAAPVGVTMTRIEVGMRTNIKAIIVIPADITAEEAGRLKKMIDASVIEP